MCGIAVAFEHVVRDGLADAQVHGFAAHLAKLVCQAYGSQAGMQNARYVKRHAVGAIEERWHDRTARTQGEPRCRCLPRRVSDGTLSPIEMRDFARWKHDQRAAGGKQAHRLAQRRPILGVGFASFERIHRNHMGA
jgi:hypothetical protein